jgi:PKD repeat protein
MKFSSLFRRTSAFFAVSLFILFSANANEIKYADSWAGQGFNLVEAEQSNVRVIHSLNSFSFGNVVINGEEMTVVNMPGVFLPNDEGAPNIPGEGRYIAMPSGAEARLNIVNMRAETFSNIEVAPSPRIPFEDDDSPLHYEKNMAIYGQNAFYPAEPVKLSEPSNIRGVDVVMLGITPFQYNPVTKELIVYRDIEVEIVFEGGNGQYGEDRYRSRWWDMIMSSAILNFNTLPEIDYNWMHEQGDRTLTGCEYLIITPDGADFVTWGDEIADFRNMQGILTDVVTLSDVGGNSTVAIENYVNNAYNNWDIPPTAVLLLGDFGYSINNSVIAPIYNSYCASDNIYADVDNDHLPDIVFARITANDATQLETMVTKFINHETNPPTNPDFYNNPITAVGWQTERWFQICGETVGGYWKNSLGKDPVRINAIYSGTPGSVWSTATNTSTVVNYFGPNGLGYIPATPSALGGWSGGTGTMINNAINSGAFIMLHRDHGYEQGWGEPAYSNASINGLTNEDLVFVMSVNCLTGKYNWSGECFTEKFHRHTAGGQNSGALGLTAASEVSYSFVNDTYVWGSIDNMWPGFMPLYGTTFPTNYAMPAFGNAAGKYFLQQSNWPYNTSNKTVTYHLFHHHGGAFLTLYYEEPMDLTIVHDGVIPFGANTFVMSADYGSLICLYRNGNIISTATGTGMMQAIPIPSLPLNANVTLTVTKQNYFRHEETLPVLEILNADFEADITTICPAGSVNFTDLTQGNPTSWLWTFEGGDPATSTDQNPEGILYAASGSYDVTLEVSTSNSTDTYTIEDYITVMEDVVVGASVYATSEEICEGEEVTFYVEVDNGGTEPLFQWKLNGVDVGDGTDSYTSSDLADGDMVSCEVTSSLECTVENPVMSNAVAMTVNEIVAVGITIETASAQICAGSEVTFTAIPENGGDNPEFQWLVNGSVVGTNSPEFVTAELLNGDVVSCELLSDASCIIGNPATSNEIAISILEELPAGVSIESAQAISCTGDEVTFTAIPLNGGEEPAFQWMINGNPAGTNSPEFVTAELLNGDVVSCTMTSSYECAINNPAVSNEITASVEPYPAQPDAPEGPAIVDLNFGMSSSYTTSNDPNTINYNWVVEPGNAYDQLSPDMNNLTITWSENFTGPVSIHVFGINDCGDGPLSANLEVSIENSFGIGDHDLNIGVSVFPNPNKGSFTIRLSSLQAEDVKLKVMSLVGEVLLNEEEIRVNGEYIRDVDLSNYAKGIYFLIIENNNHTLTEKIVIQK